MDANDGSGDGLWDCRGCRQSVSDDAEGIFRLDGVPVLCAGCWHDLRPLERVLLAEVLPQATELMHIWARVGRTALDGWELPGGYGGGISQN